MTILSSIFVRLYHVPTQAAFSLISLGAWFLGLGVDIRASERLSFKVLGLDVSIERLLFSESFVARWITGTVELGLVYFHVALQAAVRGE